MVQNTNRNGFEDCHKAHSDKGAAINLRTIVTKQYEAPADGQVLIQAGTPSSMLPLGS